MQVFYFNQKYTARFTGTKRDYIFSRINYNCQNINTNMKNMRIRSKIQTDLADRLYIMDLKNQVNIFLNIFQIMDIGLVERMVSSHYS